MKILKFEAEWCKCCKEQDDYLKDCTIPIEVIDTDNDENNLCETYEITSLPTLLLFKEDTLLKKFVGVTKLDKINQFIKEFNNES